jgi:hypothetical protein
MSEVIGQSLLNTWPLFIQFHSMPVIEHLDQLSGVLFAFDYRGNPPQIHALHSID